MEGSTVLSSVQIAHRDSFSGSSLPALPTSVVTTRALIYRIPSNHRNIQLLPLRLAWSSLHIPNSRAHELFSKTRVDVDSPIASGLLQLRDASANGDRRPRAWEGAPWEGVVGVKIDVRAVFTFEYIDGCCTGP